jgi:hypothetical protein
MKRSTPWHTGPLVARGSRKQTRPPSGGSGCAAEPRLGARLPVRRGRRQEEQAVEHRRRVHPRDTRDAGRTPMRRRSGRRRDRDARRKTRRPPLRMENGPKCSAHALCDWFRLAGTATNYIEPGSPCENDFVESFNGRVRDELLTSRRSARSSKPGRVQDLARRVQHPTASLIPRRPHPNRVRRAMDHQPASTPTTPGPLNGARVDVPTPRTNSRPPRARRSVRSWATRSIISVEQRDDQHSLVEVAV